MFRQARELLTPRRGSRRALKESGAGKTATKREAKAKAKAELRRQGRSSKKVSKRVDGDKLEALASAPTETGPLRSAAPVGEATVAESVARQPRPARHSQHRARQNQSSSSGGSSSGYLSQTNGFPASAGGAMSRPDEEPLDDGAAAFMSVGQSVGPPPSSGAQNGWFYAAQPQAAQHRAARSPRHHHAQQQLRRHLRAPTMVPMMIDDDDDDGGGGGGGGDAAGGRDQELAMENLDDHLDVRQMLASQRNRRRATEVDQRLRGPAHNGHHAGLIDGLSAAHNLATAATAADDKLSRPTYGQTGRSLGLTQAQTPMSLHRRVHSSSSAPNSHSRSISRSSSSSNSNLDAHENHQRARHPEFSRETLSSAHAATGDQQHQYQWAAYLYDCERPESLERRSLSSRQHCFSRRLPAGQQQLDAAAIYHQPHWIGPAPGQHFQQQQQHHSNNQGQLNNDSHPRHEPQRPRYLQSTRSFLYQQPGELSAQDHQIAAYSSKAALHQQQQQQRRLLAAASKPVPPVPPVPPATHRPDFASSGAILKLPRRQHHHQHQNHRQLHQSDTLNIVMQTSGSRQHLAASDQHRHQHHSSSSNSSPHLRRAAAANNHGGGGGGGRSSQPRSPHSPAPPLSRSTPTPTHMIRAAGSQQLLPAPLSRRNETLAVQQAPESAPAPAAPLAMGCCGKLAKFLLFMANALFWLAGIALGAWGILALVDDHKYNLSQLLVFEPSSRLSLFQLLSWSFITLGCATILVGFCGCSALAKNSRWILGLYIFLILAIFALDLATGLLAVIFQERLVANVRLKLVNKLRTEYGIQASFTAAIDYIQTRYECCGLDGHFDYDQSLWRLQRLGGFEATVARTCCHLRNTFDDQAHVNPRPVNESMCQSTDVRFHQSYRYRRGCLDDLERLIRHKIWTFTIGCGAVGAIILLSLVFATCFCRSISSARTSRKSWAASATGSRAYRQQAAYLETATSAAKKTKHSDYR